MNDNRKKFYHSELDVHQRHVFTQYLQLSRFLASEGVIYMADAGKQENWAACAAPPCASTCLEANATHHIPSAACAALTWNEAKDPSCQTVAIPHEQV